MPSATSGTGCKSADSSAQFVDHLPRRRFDRFLPPRGSKLLRILPPRMGEDDPARIVHDRPEPALVERRRHVGRRPALTAEARHQEPGVRHRRPQLGELLRIRRPDHRPTLP